jgi:hypothetical protein
VVGVRELASKKWEEGGGRKGEKDADVSVTLNTNHLVDLMCALSIKRGQALAVSI